MIINETSIPDLLTITPERVRDERGFFSETWSYHKAEKLGHSFPEFTQDNHSLSYAENTIRGMHFQAPPFAQGKLVRCARGSLFDVAVDIRRGSPSFGHWFGIELSFENAMQLWIPAGFLHGFITREADTEICYKCTAPYSPAYEGSVHWDSLGIDWGATGPVLLSQKDATAQSFENFETPFIYGKNS